MVGRPKEKLMTPDKFNRNRIVGEYEIILPAPPKIEEIDGYDLPIIEQRFRPPRIPTNFENLPEKQQLDYVRKELKRREEGFWFYNYGNIEYITGPHYFYCGYWKIDIGYPHFRDSDQEFFWLWDKVLNDPNCFGLVHITKRRDGKTYRSTSVLYERTSKTKDAIAGIQSKTGNDARQIFKKLVKSWKKLPFFFKPTDSGDTNPKNSLRFEEPSQRSSKGEKKIYKDVLDSEINFAPASEEAYDGYKLYTYYGDEIGKSLETDVYRRWNIVKPCLQVGNRIVGKALLTSTVEEMEKGGGANCKKIWDESDPNNLDANGRTTSGLYRLFTPADFGYEGFVDEYGRSNRELAKEYILNERKGKTGEALYSIQRKFPLSVKEAFLTDNKSSPFDLIKINEQKNYNEEIFSDRLLVQGNFVWNEPLKTVKWIPHKDGKWKIWKHPNKSKGYEPNNSLDRGGRQIPNNTPQFVAALDPIDHGDEVAGKRSNAAAYVFAKFNPSYPSETNTFVCQYINRPSDPNIVYEDIAKMCIYYGCQVLVENNRRGCINWFLDKNLKHYLMQRPEHTHTSYSKKVATNKEDYGIATSGTAARQYLIELAVTYIYENVGTNEDGKNGNIYFNELLDDWNMFDANDWGDYDATVASLLVLAASKEITKHKPEKQEGFKVADFVRKYKIR